MKFANIAVGLAATLLLSNAAFARGACHGGQPRGLQSLNLTTEQQQRLQPMFQQKKAERAQFRTQFENILTAEQRAKLGSGEHHNRGAWKDLNLTDAQKAQFKQLRESARAQRQAEHQQMQQQLAQVLTPEQMTKWQQLKSEHRGHHRHHRDGATNS